MAIIPTSLASAARIHMNQLMSNWMTLVEGIVNLAGGIILTGNINYYVRTDGNDNNNGLSNTPSGAFATLQKAADTAASLVNGNNAITINVADGTYTQNLTLPKTSGNGACTIIGNISLPANVIIAPTSSDAITLLENSIWNVQGFTITASGGSAIAIKNNAVLKFTNIVMGACSVAHFLPFAGSNSSMYAGGNYTISGGAIWHILTADGNHVEIFSKTITLTGTPNFTGSYIKAQGSSYVTHGNCTFIGGATGKKYDVSDLAIIDTNGGGINYFPGDSAGSGTTPNVAPYGYYK